MDGRVEATRRGTLSTRMAVNLYVPSSFKTRTASSKMVETSTEERAYLGRFLEEIRDFLRVGIDAHPNATIKCE